MSKCKRPSTPPHDITMSGLRELTQLAIITPDADQTMEQLHRVAGFGAFKAITARPPELLNTTYGGEAAAWSMRIGVTWVGQMQVEVIQPLEGRSVFADYLERRGGKAGIQHVFWERGDDSYQDAIERFTQAGYAWQQEAQLNAKGRLGFLPIPALPKAMASRHASRFGYTSTQDQLLVDVELARFPPGVSQRMALRAAIAERWIPEDASGSFESSLPEALLGDIDAIYILTHDLDATLQAYQKLTENPISAMEYNNTPLPGAGRIATIQFATAALNLVEPASGPIHDLLAAQGEGPSLLRGHPIASLAETRSGLQTRGWQLQPANDVLDAPFLATHELMPFALWVQSPA